MAARAARVLHDIYDKLLQNKVARARAGVLLQILRRAWQFETARRGGGASPLCSGSHSTPFVRIKKALHKLQKLLSLQIYFFGGTTCATTFAQTTYTRAVSSMAARARSGWAEAPLSGGIGHLAGTETTESDARVK